MGRSRRDVTGRSKVSTLRLPGWHRAQAQLGWRGAQRVAVGGDRCKQRGISEILGICEGAKEDKAGWSAFLKHLKERGLNGVRLIISDGCMGLAESAAEFFADAAYAAGDAAGKGPPLTPVSSHDRKGVAALILEGNRHQPDYRGVPSLAFTLPPIAAVGLPEVVARRQTSKLRVNAANVADSSLNESALWVQDSDR